MSYYDPILLICRFHEIDSKPNIKRDFLEMINDPNFDINKSYDVDTETLLNAAVFMNIFTCVKLLLEKGAKLNRLTLHSTIFTINEDSTFEIFKYLIKAGAIISNNFLDDVKFYLDMIHPHFDYIYGIYSKQHILPRLLEPNTNLIPDFHKSRLCELYLLPLVFSYVC